MPWYAYNFYTFFIYILSCLFLIYRKGIWAWSFKYEWCIILRVGLYNKTVMKLLIPNLLQ